MREIKTVIYPKQCKEYYDAVEKEDWWAAELWRMPIIYRSWESVQSEMRMNEIVANYEAETKFAEELPPELLDTYIKVKFNIKEEPIKTSSFWSFDWLFKN